MGRRRKNNLHLSRDYAEALALWAEHEGREGKNNGLFSGMIDRFIPQVLPSYSPKTKEDYLRYCGDCVFQTKPATDSTAKLPPIPFESCH
jgi:hypothetical protein